MDYLVLLALSPLILLIAIALFLRKSIIVASAITFVYTLLISLFVWKIKSTYVSASIVKGLLVAVDISLIVFGAIFFLNFMKKTALLKRVSLYLSDISPDRRIQGIIIVWFFGSFLEGIAGFGTPAAVVAPLLVGLGFPAVTSIIIALIGNSVPVTFGALGTPIKIGFSSFNFSDVGLYAVMINLLLGALIPVMILFFIVSSKKGWKKKQFFEILPFAIYAGFAFMIPYFFFYFLGIEFPTFLGSLIGMFIVISTTKKGLLIPESIQKKSKARSNIFTSFLPYALLVIFLLIAKFVIPTIKITIEEGVTHNLNFSNPGIIFFITVIICSLLYKMKGHGILDNIKESLFSVRKPIMAIFLVVSFIQLMMNSKYNFSGLEGMIETIAELAEVSYLPIISPFIGAFGAFIAGSATVSNILFGPFQAAAATSLGYNVSIILALQLVGAAVGNMIALTNIIAAEATVKLHGKEREILAGTIMPCIIYLFLVSILGTVFILIF